MRRHDMAIDEPERTVLALNRGSSSLKFGLYRADAAQTEMLLSGEAAAIGDKGAKFDARNARGDVLVSETADISDQRSAIIRVGKLLSDAKLPAPAAIGHRIVHGGPQLREHCLIDDAVLRQLLSRRCIRRRRCRSSALPKSIFPACRKRRASTPIFTPHYRTSRGCCRSPRNFNPRASSATGFTACLANRSCASWAVTSPRAWSSPISATAPAL